MRKQNSGNVLHPHLIDREIVVIYYYYYGQNAGLLIMKADGTVTYH